MADFVGWNSVFGESCSEWTTTVYKFGKIRNCVCLLVKGNKQNAIVWG